MKDLEERIKKLAQWMFDARSLVVFTGAGISTESGLPDFRARMESGRDRRKDSLQKQDLSLRRA